MAETESNDDLLFRHFPLKHRVTAWISMHLFDSITYTVHHGLLKGMKRKGGLGWMPQIFSPGAVTAEHMFWHDLDLSGMTVYDVGAFHGLVTLFFSSRAKQVVSFEPNSANRKRLLENIALNKITNVTVRPVGVGSKPATCQMARTPLMPGGASVDARSVDRLLKAGVGAVVEEVSIVTLDEEIPRAGLPKPDFIKIDIEGLELDALQGAVKTLEVYAPVLFLEMHGETVREKKRKVQEIVDFLWENGYRNIHHIESNSGITPANAETAMEGHLYCKKG